MADDGIDAQSVGDPDLDPPKPGDAEAFVRGALARFKLTDESESENRQEALKDDKFRNLDQWDEKVAKDRLDKGLPALTIDKLNHPIRQVLNAQRQARPGIKVNPKTAGSAQETAQIIQGLVRHIEYDSQADIAYDWAFEGAASSGIAYFRIITEFAGETEGLGVWDQEIKIKKVHNKYSVYFDPSAVEPDKSDARWCFVTEDIPLEEYKLLYPRSRVTQANSFSGLGDTTAGWLSEKSVRVAEYFYVVPKSTRKLQLKGGRIVDVEADDKWVKGKTYDKTPILNHRDVDSRVVMWAKINAVEILEGNDKRTEGQVWPGTYIPVVPVIGEELFIDGKRIYRGMVRPARDAQRMVNWQSSELVRTMGKWGRVPWVGYEGQFKGHEKKWGSANVEDWPYLEVVPVTSSGGQILPHPTRDAQEPPIQAIVMGLQQSSEDIKSTTGFFDPSLGQVNSRDRSGRAILALQQAGELGSSNFQDNLRRALIYAGKIIVDLIPHIYDRTGRIVTIIGKDDKPTSVMFNQPFMAGEGAQPPQPIMGAATDGSQVALPPGHPLVPEQAKFYDLKKSRFSVTVSVGRSHATKRMELKEGIEPIFEKAPQLLPALAAPYLRAQDWEGAEEMANRVDKMFPEFQDDEDGAPRVPPQVKAQMDQLLQQHEILTKLLEAKDEIIRTKQLELASKEKQTGLQEETKLAIAQLRAEMDRMKLDSATLQTNAQFAHDARQTEGQRQHEGRLKGEDREHDLTMAEMDAQHGRATQFTDMAHQRGMAAEQRAMQPPQDGGAAAAP